jgi:hypothetical protein
MQSDARALWLTFLLAAVCTMQAALPAQAQSDCLSLLALPGTDRTQMLGQIQLSSIRAHELFAGSSSAQTVGTPAELQPRRYRPNRIIRKVDRLWWRKLPIRIRPERVLVRLQIAQSGRTANDAAHSEQPNQRLPILARPTPTVRWCKDNNYQIVTGGAILEIFPTKLPAAGQYETSISAETEIIQ